MDFWVGVKAGTVGAGVYLSMSLTKTINLRASLTSIKIDNQTETLTIGNVGSEGDIAAILNFDYGASALLFDWYVFNGTFHLTAGMMKNNGKVDFSGTLLSDVVLDSGPLSTADISGDITGSIGLGNTYQPYLGIGWGRKAGNDAGISLSIEIGVALLDPAAELSATAVGDPGLLSQTDLDIRINSAENDINAELDQLEAWPIISIGFNYAF